MEIIYDLTNKQISQLHKLYQKEWWTENRTLEETVSCVNGSQLCIGCVDDSGDLQGFARVITDFTFKALILDVIVSSNNRGFGVGALLLESIRNHRKVNSVKHFELYCLPELEGFYTELGFSTSVGGIKLMRCINT